MQSNLAKEPRQVKAVDIIHKIFHFSIPSWISFIINIGSTIIVTRYFLPDAYGLINTFNASATLVMAFVCLGIDSGFQRFFYETPDGFDRKRLLLVSVLIPLLLLVFVSVVLITCMPTRLSILIFGIDNFSLLVLLLVDVLALLFIRFLSVYYRLEGNVFLYAVVSVLMQLALKVPLVFASFINPDYEFAILLSVLAMICIVVFFLLLNGRKLLPARKSFSIAEIIGLKQFLIYSIYVWPVPIFLYLNVVVTQILIRAQLGNDAVGIFASVSIFLGIVTVLQAGFSTYWSGFMFENYQTQKDLIIKMHDYLSFFIIILMVNFVLFRDLIFLLIGVKYHASKPLFALLLLNPLLLILSETTGYGISISQKSYLMLISTVVSIVVNLGMIWLLMPAFGLIGASIGSAVSGVFLFVLQSYFAQKYYKSIENVWRTVNAVLFLAILAVANMFYEKFCIEIAATSITILLITALIYRSEISQFISLTRRMLVAHN